MFCQFLLFHHADSTVIYQHTSWFKIKNFLIGSFLQKNYSGGRGNFTYEFKLPPTLTIGFTMSVGFITASISIGS